MKIEKINSLSIFLPLVWGGQRREISLPGVYKTARGGRLRIVDLWRQYKNATFADSLFQCFSLCKGRKMVLRCVVYGCSNTKNVKKWNRESAKAVFLYWRHRSTIPSLPPCAVLYTPGSEISRLWPPQTRGRKVDSQFIFSIFIREQQEDSIKQIKKNLSYTL